LFCACARREEERDASKCKKHGIRHRRGGKEHSILQYTPDVSEGGKTGLVFKEEGRCEPPWKKGQSCANGRKKGRRSIEREGKEVGIYLFKGEEKIKARTIPNWTCWKRKRERVGF